MALQPYHGRRLFLTRWIIKFIPSDDDPLDFNIKLSGLMTPTPVGPIEDTNECQRRRKRKYYTFTPYTTDFLETVQGPKLLEFENKETIALVDGMSYEEGLKIGYPANFIDYFRFGFPPTWEFIISKFYLSINRCITNGEVPRGVRPILKNTEESSNQLAVKDKERTDTVQTNHKSVLRPRNKVDVNSKRGSTSKDTPFTDKNKTQPQVKTPYPQKNNKIITTSTSSTVNKDRSKVSQQEEIPIDTSKNNSRSSRSTRLRGNLQQVDIPSASKSATDRSIKKSLRSHQTSRSAETHTHNHDIKDQNQVKRSQSKKSTIKTDILPDINKKQTQSQPLKSCLRKGSTSSIDKENSKTSRSSFYTKQQTFRTNRSLNEKIILPRRSPAGCKRHSDDSNEEDSPSRKAPRQSTGKEYKYFFVKSQRVECKKSGIVLPKCI